MTSPRRSVPGTSAHHVARRARHLLTIGLCLATVGACAGSGAESTAADAGKKTDGGYSLPKGITDKGEVRIASDTNFPPLEFVPANGSEPIGLDVDIANALGQVLGVKMAFVNTKFDGIIPALQAGRYDMGMSGINHTPERAKAVDFVDYLVNPGTSLVVPKGNPDGLHAEADLCGHAVGVLNGTVQQAQLKDVSDQCGSAGKAAVDVKTFPLFPNAIAALSSKRLDAVIGGGMPVAYQIKQSKGQFEGVQLKPSDIKYGIAVPKTSGELSQALRDALNKIIENGTYNEILEEWGAEQFAVGP